MHDLAPSWLAAAADATIRAQLEAVYAHIAAETRMRRPLCVASGRCCNFEKFGHRLYVTGLEAAYVVASLAREASSGVAPAATEAAIRRRAEPSQRTEDDQRIRPQSPGSISLPQIERARQQGNCPFLVNNLCSIHQIKPLGCRVYFCDPLAQDWQQALSEESLARVRSIHETHGIEYRYGEWRGMLAAVVEAAASADPDSPELESP